MMHCLRQCRLLLASLLLAAYALAPSLELAACVLTESASATASAVLADAPLAAADIHAHSPTDDGCGGQESAHGHCHHGHHHPQPGVAPLPAALSPPRHTAPPAVAATVLFTSFLPEGLLRPPRG